MINVLPRILRRDNSLKNGFFLVKSFRNPFWIERNSSNCKFFSVGNVCYQDQRKDGTVREERQLPSLFYIQNPITWLINKIDFFMLKNAWDPEFEERDFKRGVRQAVSVICTLISQNFWDDLKGLVSSKALARIKRDVEVNWNEEQRKSIAIEPSDIKVILPRKVHFLRIADQRFVDVDAVCVAIKFNENGLSDTPEIILIEVLARFHRNYSLGQIPKWTVTLFKVTNQDVKKQR